MYKIRNKIRLFLLPENAKSVLSVICFFLGLICVPVSAFLMLHDFPSNMENREYSNQLLSIFIGLWAINLIGIANFLKSR
jgi:hypothetical protein